MLTKYIVRGVKAGAVGGLAFGAFVALVGNPLVRYAETFESGGHGAGPVVSGTVTTAVSIGGGVLLGILLGALVFGVAFYFLEPIVPGAAGTKSYLLGAAGFVAVSGAPWLVLPPQPPGVEQALPAGTRLLLYVGLLVAGAIACGGSAYTYSRLRTEYGPIPAFGAALVPFGLLVVVAGLAPANSVSGPVPEGLATVFRTVIATGQVGLWLVLASAHALLLGRERAVEPVDTARSSRTDGPGSVPSD